MAIKPGFTMGDVRRRLDDFLDAVRDRQIARIQQLGEICVNHARSVPASQGFEDQTGNLRSSIGYMVFVDGVAVHGKYERVAPKNLQAGGVLNGAEVGRALAERVGGDTTGVSLVVTAGMDYAVYVEAKGRDVLTSAEQLAERLLPEMIRDLTKNIRNV